jgi:3-hydroxyisobutyrate dehydrogenase
METIGLIGVGAMGTALLERLRAAGAEVVAYDRHAPALENAARLGAKPAKSAKEVAERARLVDVVVRTDDEVLDCVGGADGLLEGARPGTLVLLHSTILPDTTLKAAAAARGRGVAVMDACMAGVPEAVRAGNLVFLAGGSEELLERARPHLRRMGKRVIHVGPLGSGNVAKLVINLFHGAQTLLLEEMIRLGKAGGIPYPEMLEILRETRERSVLDRWQSVFDPEGRDPRPRSGRNIMGKDIPLAGELGRRYGLELPIVERIVEAAGRASGGGGS